MKRRKRVYVTGPLNGDGTTSKEDNVRRAIEAGKLILDRGYAPFVPHLTWYADPNDEHGYGNWIESDLAWVEVADALLRLRGYSAGTDVECGRAMELGIPVVDNNIEDLDRALHQGETILDEAKRLVYGNRNRHYGHPRDNFRTIAMLWTIYLKEVGVAPIEPRHVAMMMILMKVARDINMANRDNIVDIAGYAATADRLLEEE